jgi:hypothetical protein
MSRSPVRVLLRSRPATRPNENLRFLEDGKVTACPLDELLSLHAPSSEKPTSGVVSSGSPTQGVVVIPKVAPDQRSYAAQGGAGHQYYVSWCWQNDAGTNCCKPRLLLGHNAVATEAATVVQ